MTKEVPKEKRFGLEVTKKKEMDPKWLEWGEVGRAEVVGYEIGTAEEGANIDKLQKKRFMEIWRPFDFIYHHSYGMVSPFFEGLLDKKLMGTRCPKCGDRFMPPRANCWRPSCKLQETEWVELPLRGTLHTFSIMYFAGTPFLRLLPAIIGYVRVEGCNMAMVIFVKEVDPTKLQCDMPVEIKFIDEPKGDPTDIYVVPAKGWKPVEDRFSWDEEGEARIVRNLKSTKEHWDKVYGKDRPMMAEVPD